MVSFVVRALYHYNYIIYSNLISQTATECRLKWEAIKRAFANYKRRQRGLEFSGAPAGKARSAGYKYDRHHSFLDRLKGVLDEDVQEANDTNGESEDNTSALSDNEEV